MFIGDKRSADLEAPRIACCDARRMGYESLRQRWPMPKKPRPIVSIGAGGIVRDAHYPAYRKAGFEVHGLFDARADAALSIASAFGVKRVFRTIEEAASSGDVVFDVAVPADQIVLVLRELPERAIVLIQKPMGRDLAEAKKILSLCRAKKLVAAINFQLRFSPNMLALRDAIGRGDLGEIADVDVRVNTYMPWHLWTFMRGIPRMEILYHSIHYLDLVRSLVGEPSSVHAAAVPHPNLRDYADTRTSAILVYGDRLRCSSFTNHAHTFGPEHACSQIQIEGTRGAAFAQMGVNLDYPRGRPDELAFASRVREGRTGPSDRRRVQDRKAHWKHVLLIGSWFPEAFIGTMSNLQRFAAGEDDVLETSVEDAVKTMALVEALYRSSSKPGTLIPKTTRAPRRSRRTKSR
jgi:predicted dehydrogenase